MIDTLTPRTERRKDAVPTDVQVSDLTKPPASKGWSRRHLNLLRLVGTLAIFAWLAWRTNWPKLGEAFARLDVGLWAAGLGLYILSQIISAYRWKLLSRPLGFQGSVPEFTRLNFIGMFFNLVLPTSVGGDVVRAWYLHPKPGRRVDAFLSVLTDRVTGLMVLMIVACVAVVVSPIPLQGWVVASVWAMTAAMALGLASLPLIPRLFPGFHRLDRLQKSVLYIFHHPRLLVETSILSALVQAANICMVWLIGLAIQVPAPGAYYWILVPMVSLLTMLPVSINGMGLREGFTAMFLTPLGVDRNTAYCLSLLWFFAVTVAGLLGGLVYYFGHYARPRMEGDHELIGCDPDQGRAGQSRAVA